MTIAWRRALSLFVAILLSLGWRACAFAADFYQGKTVTMLVSSEAGGGYDLYGRLVAKYMQRHVPGHPNLVVRNMTGAGGLAATNYLVNVAPADGMTIGQIQNTAPFEKLFGVKGSSFDPLALRFIGSANSEVAVAFTWRTSPTKTFRDLLQRETIMAGSTGAISAIDARAMNELLGAKIKLVTGYAGTAQSFLAIERGEAEGFPSIFWSSLKASKPDWLAQHKINLLVQLALAKDRELPTVPLIFDFTHTPVQHAAFSLLLTPQAIGRPFVVAPQVPAQPLAILRTAFADALRDPDFLAEAKKLNLEIQYMSADDAERLLRAAYASKPAAIAQVRQFMTGAN